MPDHPSYWPAKKSRDFYAAVSVCDDLVQEDVLEQVYICGEGRNPRIVAPAMTPHDSQNVLAIGYAQWLAKELGWSVDKGIFQSKTVSRDFETDGWFRIAHDPQFYGPVSVGLSYIVADDVVTMGGTIASLRGYIETNGGTVVCCTALASPSGGANPIAIEPETLERLNSRFDGQLVNACLEDLGYDVECLTEAEGQFLRRCASLDAFRKGINGARNG